MIALLFAGQGVAPPFVSAAVLARAASRPLLEAASDAAHEDIPALLARGGRALSRTDVLQPALVAACLCAADGLAADYVAGHSLGELAAWAAGGFVAATDAIAAAGVRGRLMAREAAAHPGGMLAVHGDAATVARALAAGRAAGALVVAAENAPDETVLSGDEAAIAAAARAVPATRLAVAGAWHSPAMAGARDELAAALSATAPAPALPRARFVANRTGDVAPADSIPAMLADQLVHPIRFTALLATLAARGVDRFVIPGPGKLLRALVRKTLGDVRVELA